MTKIIPLRKVLRASSLPINRMTKQETRRANLERENTEREVKKEFDIRVF
jgi:hypothetical protein